MPTPDDLLRQLADRGQPRGASAVFSAATERTATPPPTRILLAAAVVVAVVAAAAGFALTDGGDTTRVAAPGRAEVEDPEPSGPSGDTSTGDGPPTTPPDGTPADPGDDHGAVAPLEEGEAVTTHLESHGSCSAVLDRLRALGLEAVGPYGFRDGAHAVGAPASGTSSADAARPASPSPDGPSSRSNVQEPGVDEADLVKTDGEILVAVARDRLQVVSVTDRSLLSSLELSVGVGPLFLVEDTVVVIGSPTHHDDGPETPVVLVDVSEPAAPAVRSTTWIEGVVRSSRLQNGVVRLVTGDSPRFAWETPSEDSDAARERAEAENRRRVEQSTLETWLPDYRTVDGEGHTIGAGHAASCDSTHTPSRRSGFDTTTVVTLDPTSGTVDPGTSVAATPHVVYASEASLYVVSSACCPGSPRDRRSDVHRFDLSSPTAAPYRSSGSVRGLPVDQFALSERDGHLRIATTYLTSTTTTDDGGGQRDRPPARSTDTDSAVWVLAEHGESLEVVGGIDGLGEEGERIFSVRYHDRFAYVVTFRRTDPLYVVDLRDPSEPRLRGELHVPGFSTFLQHVGNGQLVGVGRDADAEGRARGLQLSLFDVSDPAAPARDDVLTYERGASPAEHDHLAFLHWAPEDLVVVPMFEMRTGPASTSDTDRCDVFAGALMIDLDGSSLVETGRVSHAEHAERDDSTAVVPIRRSAVAGNSLLTLSDLGLAFGDLADGEEEDFVTFEGRGPHVERVPCDDEPSRDPDEDPDDETFPFPL